MTIRRRDFLKVTGFAAFSAGLPRLARSADSASVYDIEKFGNARILHLTDVHAQLRPVYFREPSVNIGIGEMLGRPPHLVGKAFLDRFGISADSAEAYAFTSLDFEKSAQRFGKLGGFAAGARFGFGRTSPFIVSFATSPATCSWDIRPSCRNQRGSQRIIPSMLKAATVGSMSRRRPCALSSRSVSRIKS